MNCALRFVHMRLCRVSARAPDQMGAAEAPFDRSGADGGRRLRIIVVRAENALIGLCGRHHDDRNRRSDGRQSFGRRQIVFLCRHDVAKGEIEMPAKELCEPIMAARGNGTS